MNGVVILLLLAAFLGVVIAAVFVFLARLHQPTQFTGDITDVVEEGERLRRG